MDAVSQQVVEEVQATMAGTDGIYHKIEKVLTILESNGWAQKMTIQPKDILCHPSNRGGAMLSFYDVWSKGKAMLSVGLQKKLLHGSIAMEVSKKSTKRSDQIAKNQQLVKDSQGHLAPVSGQERFLASFCFSISQKLLLFLMLLGKTLFGSSAGFLSLSSSHTVAFLRAMEAGVPGPDGHQAEVPKADASWQCIDQGWLWVVISSVVEEAIPQLATWLQLGMNSSNSIGKPQTELELAATIATMFTQGLDLAQAMKRAKEGDIKCQASLGDVTTYVQKLAGGKSFPLIFFLATFAKQFGNALMIGQELMATLANMDFKVPGQLFPFIRLAAWTTMATGNHKAIDGFAKILSKSDLDRLKSNQTTPKTMEAETILADAWNTIEKLANCDQANSQKIQEGHYQKCFGKLAIRVILFICQKQKNSRETNKHWTSIQEILEQFKKDCESTECSQSSAAAPTEPETREVKDLLTATPETMALIQNNHLKIGYLYLVIVCFVVLCNKLLHHCHHEQAKVLQPQGP